MAPFTGWLTLALLAFGFGVVFLTRNSLGYLGPFMTQELSLDHGGIGLLAAAFSLTWAVSGIVVTALAIGQHKRALLLSLLFALGLSSVVASLAPSFLVLFCARLAAGLCSGPILPLAQAYVARMGSGNHRGLRMGIVQGMGSSLLGSVVAPLLLVPMAVHWSWRGALLLIAGIALLATALLAIVLPRDSHSTSAPRKSTPSRTSGDVASPSSTAARRNVTLCCLISSAMIGWLILTLTFYPAFLLEVRHRSTAEMSSLMSLVGLGSLFAALLVPHLSDRYERRTIMIVFALVGAIGPATLLVAADSLPLLGIGMFLGSFGGGTIPLFMAVIPSESVSPRKLPAAIGLIQGVGEIAGGVIAPALGGWVAVRSSTAAPLAFALLAALLAALFSCALLRAPRARP